MIRFVGQDRRVCRADNVMPFDLSALEHERWDHPDAERIRETATCYVRRCPHCLETWYERKRE